MYKAKQVTILFDSDDESIDDLIETYHPRFLKEVNQDKALLEAKDWCVVYAKARIDDNERTLEIGSILDRIVILLDESHTQEYNAFNRIVESIFDAWFEEAVDPENYI